MIALDALYNSEPIRKLVRTMATRQLLGASRRRHLGADHCSYHTAFAD